MIILGLDPAASCGWSAIDGFVYIDGGANRVDYPSKVKQKKGLQKGQKWLDFLNWISMLLDRLSPDAVIAEDVRRHTSTLAGHSYGFFRYAIEAECARRGVRFYPIGVTEWKKIASGKGSSKKSTVADAMEEVFGEVQFQTDDHSDSLGIAMAGMVLWEEGRLESLLEPKPKKRKKPECQTKESLD